MAGGPRQYVCWLHRSSVHCHPAGPMTRRSLGSSTILVLQALARGFRYGFDVMDATELPSGTVYPILSKLEAAGLARSAWEDARIARREKRPPRRYYEITAAGATELDEAMQRLTALAPRRRPGPARPALPRPRMSGRACGPGRGRCSGSACSPCTAPATWSRRSDRNDWRGTWDAELWHRVLQLDRHGRSPCSRASRCSTAASAHTGTPPGCSAGAWRHARCWPAPAGRAGAGRHTGRHRRGRVVAGACPGRRRHAARRDAGGADACRRHRARSGWCGSGTVRPPRTSAGRVSRRSSFGRSVPRARRSRPWPACARRS